MFYAFPYALRFELGAEGLGMDQPVSRFVQAFDRVRAVAKAAIGQFDEVQVCFCLTGAEVEAQPKRLQHDLQRVGFDASKLQHLATTAVASKPPGAEDYQQERRRWVGQPLQGESDIDKLLWGAIAAEMPISPSVTGRGAYLIDWKAGVVVHVYDDRGMDVIAPTRETLLPLYERFNSWLLDYDRQAMDAVFGTAASPEGS